MNRFECVAHLQGAEKAFQDLIHRLQERNHINDQDLERRIYIFFARLDDVFLILGENGFQPTPIEVDLSKDYPLQYHQIIDEIQRARRFLEIAYSENEKIIESKYPFIDIKVAENILFDCAIKILKRIS